MLSKTLHPGPVRRTSLLAALVLISAGVSQAQITGELWLNTSAGGNAVLTAAAGLGTPDATFNSGAFNYNPTDDSSVYTVGAFLNNPTFNNPSAAFTTAGGASAGLDNTYFYFTGNISLNAGHNSFVVGHDDGLQLNIDGIGLVVNAPGPTGLDETPFDVDAPTAGTYSFELSYGECCGPPASLVWDINNVTVGNVPDAASTQAMLGIGLVTLGAFGRRIKIKK